MRKWIKKAAMAASSVLIIGVLWAIVVSVALVVSLVIVPFSAAVESWKVGQWGHQLVMDVIFDR